MTNIFSFDVKLGLRDIYWHIAVSLLVLPLLFSCGKEEESPSTHPAVEEPKEAVLPELNINLPQGHEINSKTVWVENATASLVSENGNITELGGAKIKGRGNSTWNYPKKPYALKLDKDASLLGMPAGKRWDLLANYIDRTEILA